MRVTLGFHFISLNQLHNAAILSSLKEIRHDGDVELVDTLDNGFDLCRVWTLGTPEAFHNSADLLMQINNGGPVIFVFNDLHSAEFRKLFKACVLNDIEVEDTGDNTEIFVYIENADQIRLLSNTIA